MGLDEESPEADILSAITHGKKLISHYQNSILPVILGMPTWNAITTSTAVRSKPHQNGIVPERDFELISAIYLLSFPNRMAWVFPNCRVSQKTQMESIITAGCFTSGMVRVGPGAYLQYKGKESLERAFSKCSIPINSLNDQRILQGEQFVHHFHSQEDYNTLFRENGITQVSETIFLEALSDSNRMKTSNQAA